MRSYWSDGAMGPKPISKKRFELLSKYSPGIQFAKLAFGDSVARNISPVHAAVSDHQSDYPHEHLLLPDPLKSTSHLSRHCITKSPICSKQIASQCPSTFITVTHGHHELT
jgi:hypothetical protein